MMKSSRVLDRVDRLLAKGSVDDASQLLETLFARARFRHDLVSDDNLMSRLREVVIHYARVLVGRGLVSDARSLLSVLRSQENQSDTALLDCYLAWCDLHMGGEAADEGAERLTKMLETDRSEGIAAVCCQMLGEYFLRLQRFREAIAIYDRCLSLFEGRQGMEDIVAGALLGKSDGLSGIGKAQDALELLSKVMTLPGGPQWGREAADEKRRAACSS